MQVDYITDWSGHRPSQVNGISVDGTIAQYGNPTYIKVAPAIYSYVSPSSGYLVYGLAMIDQKRRRCLVVVAANPGDFYTTIQYADVIHKDKVDKKIALKSNNGTLGTVVESQNTILSIATLIPV